MLTSILYTVFSICFVLVSIALVHEFGHYITAKLSGIWVLEFSIGFGNRIWKKKIKDTLYSFRPFPLGGFVRLAGMDNIEESENQENPDPDLPLVPINHPKSYVSRPAWAKVIVLAAGATMNLIWAIVLLIAIYLINGGPVSNICVMDAPKDRPAYVAGIRPGDIITTINGKKITDWQEGIAIINNSPGKAVILDVIRNHPINKSVSEGGLLPTDTATNNQSYQIHDEEKLQISVVPDNNGGKGQIGIQLQPNNYDFTKLSFGVATMKGFKDGINIISQTIGGLIRMITRETKADVAGPVKIMKMIKDQSNKGLAELLYLTAILSVNIGLLNILPFPVLDGGRIVFVVLNAILGYFNKLFGTKLKISSDVEESIHFIGMIILLALVVFVTYKDISGLVTK